MGNEITFSDVFWAKKSHFRIYFGQKNHIFGTISLIEQLQSLMSGITQRISRDDSTHEVLLRDILIERKEKNKDLLPVYSVSVSEGVVNQIEYLGRSFAANDTSNYNVVHYGDIIYTKSPTGEFPFGIIKRSSVNFNVAVSPLYGIYQPISRDLGVYLHYYFCSPLNTQNYLHKLIQKGAKNTINITNQNFLENYVPIPNEGVLRKFVHTIKALSEKVNSEQTMLSALQQQKMYLLGQMFI